MYTKYTMIEMRIDRLHHRSRTDGSDDPKRQQWIEDLDPSDARGLARERLLSKLHTLTARPASTLTPRVTPGLCVHAPSFARW